jgi:hypothetical protein
VTINIEYITFHWFDPESCPVTAMYYWVIQGICGASHACSGTPQFLLHNSMHNHLVRLVQDRFMHDGSRKLRGIFLTLQTYVCENLICCKISRNLFGVNSFTSWRR